MKSASLEKVHDYSIDQIRESLRENNACYVLITCQRPTQDGNMSVEMSYDGDETLASYLVENAQSVLDHSTRDEAISSGKK